MEVAQCGMHGLGRRRRRAAAGFTLIEALTVVALLAITLAIAVPNLRDFLVKNKVAGLSNEFSGALLQARALAVAKNSCVTLCASTTVAANAKLACSTGTQHDYQQGWIIFSNPACNAALSSPAAASVVVLGARQGESNGYRIKPLASSLSSITFDPRGTAALGAQGVFQVLAPSGNASTFNRNVCVDFSGRSSVRKYDASGCV